jgi:hypothetical protein
VSLLPINAFLCHPPTITSLSLSSRRSFFAYIIYIYIYILYNMYLIPFSLLKTLRVSSRMYGGKIMFIILKSLKPILLSKNPILSFIILSLIKTYHCPFLSIIYYYIRCYNRLYNIVFNDWLLRILLLFLWSSKIAFTLLPLPCVILYIIKLEHYILLKEMDIENFKNAI